MIIHKLFVGDEEVVLADDVNTGALQSEILLVIGQGGGYVNVRSNGSRPDAEFYVSSEIPHRFERLEYVSALDDLG